MPHAKTLVVVALIISFLTGYYLALKNMRPKQTFTTHGIHPDEQPEERISPRPDSEAYEDQ